MYHCNIFSGLHVDKTKKQMADYSDTATSYDIQGQIVGDPNTDSASVLPSGFSDNKTVYSAYTKDDASSPQGEGNDTIPSTAPGLQDPSIIQSQKPQDFLNATIDANVAGMKAQGVDLVKQENPSLVINAMPTASNE